MSANVDPVYEKGAHVGRKGSGVQSNPIRRVRPSRAHRLSTMWRRAVLRLMVPHGKTRPTSGHSRPAVRTLPQSRHSGLPAPASVTDRLKRERGHLLQKVRVNGGGYQGILIDPRTGVLHGGTETRKDGAAIGY